ncbi:helix-turn-helix domain-containing protein [Terriglobus saanensis]
MSDLHAELDLKTLAAESGYSRGQFLRMFNAAMGCTPHQHILQVRVMRAQELMRQKAFPLSDVAAACGFSSHAHMSRVFHQVLGVTPSTYRRSI